MLPFEKNRQYKTLVQVRKNGVKGFVDGKLIVNYPTDFADLRNDSWHDLKDKTALGLSCDDPAAFYAMHLIEASGSGKR